MNDELSSEDLASQLKALQASLVEAEEALTPIESEKADLKHAEQEAYEAYQLEVAKVRQRRLDLDAKAYEFQVKVNQAKQQARDIERQIKYKQEQEELAAKRAEREEAMARLNAQWEQLTISAAWREWAKDHQIKGGRKITEDRNVILADPMGLGKTLTSIIACDMAEAATRETSPEFPFLGEEKQVYESAHWKNAITGAVIYSNWDVPKQEDGTIDEDIWQHVPHGYVTKIVNSIQRPVGKRILYFCPASMIRNVEKEFRMWAKHRNVTFIGGMTKAERGFVFEHVLKDRADFVVICNYEAWRKDTSLIDSLIALDYDTIIIDEAHNVKNLKSNAYRGIKRLVDEGKPEYVIPMTGTPILNRPQELFTLLTLVAPQQFFRLNDFLYDFCEQPDSGQPNYWTFKPGGLERIAQKISKNFLRRTKDQAGIELPEKTITVHSLQVDKEAYPGQARVRKQMKETATIMIDEAKGKAVAAAAIIAVFTRLRQVETWPAGIKVERKEKKDGHWVVVETTQVDVEESQKLDYVIALNNEDGTYEGLIPEIIEDERVVLFSQFKAPLRELQTRIESMGKSAVILDGDTPDAIRQQIMVDFDNRYTSDRSTSKWDVVLCNYRVGGVGMNLTAATQMIILDEEWNPGKRDQAYDRIHRIGQDKPVTIHVIRNEKTIDDWLASIMESKESIVDGFNNTMISMDDVKDFLDDSGLA